MGFIMARLFAKSDGHQLDGRDINGMYAHMYVNLLNFAIDGLGSADQQFLYTNPFATDNVATNSFFVYGSGSYTTVTGSSAPDAPQLITTVHILDSTDYDTAIVRVIGSRANTSREQIEVSFDNGTTYQEMLNNTLHKIPTNTGSLVVRYTLNRTDETTTDVVDAIGVYYG